MDYASNSHKSKAKTVEQPPAEKRVVKQVANGVRKKKGFGKKLAESFIQNDVENVKSYVIDDVVIPGIKRAILDAICNSVSMLFYGDTRGSYFDDSPRRRSYRSYSSMYEPRQRRERRAVEEPARRYSDLDATDEIEYETKGSADDVIKELNEIIDVYGLASVADFYEASRCSCDHVCNNYGWTNIDGAVAHMKPNGKWMLIMPKSMPIDNM